MALEVAHYLPPPLAVVPKSADYPFPNYLSLDEHQQALLMNQHLVIVSKSSPPSHAHAASQLFLKYGKMVSVNHDPSQGSVSPPRGLNLSTRT